MKIKVLILLLIGSMFFVGCDNPRVTRAMEDNLTAKVKIKTIPITIYRTYSGPDYYLAEIEGHKYLTPYSSGSGGIIHAESCSCKNK